MWAKAGRKGIILCGRQFMNSLDDSSLEEIKAAIESSKFLRPHFEIGEKYVRTKDGRVSYKFIGLDRNIDSVKSKAKILLCWVDEAEPVVEEAWTKLIPTLREEDSELWVTWNPERKASATHKRFRLGKTERMKIVRLNFRDNPWFPAILERTRQDDMKNRPDDYPHVWEGDFKTANSGAYFAASLTKVRQEGRVGKVALRKRGMGERAYWLPIGADPRFSKIPQHPEPGLVVSVGRLVPVKRMEILIEAIAIRRRNDPSAKLVLVGDGPERARLETLAAQAAPGAVEFVGAGDPAAWLACASMFALASRHEGWGIAAVEAAMVHERTESGDMRES
jgi:glycosyltransferase involved in cell wall biosynthesis